jgi:hypothetical protein
MATDYQRAFESLFEFSKQPPGARLSERSFEWESGGGSHRKVHLNHVITLEGALDDRPFLILFQSDPPEGAARGLELFLSAKQVPVDLQIRPRPLFAWFVSGKLKVRSERLKHLLLTSPRQYRERAARLINQSDLELPLGEIDWGQVRAVELQEGAGVSATYAGASVFAVSAGWLRAQLEPLVQLLLAC